MTKHQLERYLAQEIHGRIIPRKPPQKAKTGRGPQRDPNYLAWIRTLPSLVSGQYGCEACHFGTDGGMGQKASDYSTGPLTPREHREYHRIGKPAFARKYGLDYTKATARLNAEWAALRGAA